MADDGKSCASCGNPLPAGLPMKVCPACLLGRGLSMMSGERTRVKVGDFVPPEPEDLELIFPDFRVKRLIGRGGMGAVYQAEQVDLEREVAVKILPPEVAGDEEFRERFRREAATLAQLDHPNIVKLFDYGEREGYFYFVMEYVEGADLADRMKDGEFSMAQILSVISQVCDALDDAHGQGVVHRDIKPGNILIDETGRTKIVDFGLAKVVEGDEVDPGLTRTQSSMGTPQYMAPEQMAGSKDADHRSDIYAIGVVLYELLTGKIPAGHFKPPSEQKPTLNPRLDEVVLRALKSEPEQRYQRASDIKSGLHEAMEKPQRSAQEQSRRTTLKVVTAAVVASAAGGFGVWWTGRKSGEDGYAALPIRREVYRVIRLGADGGKLPTIPVTSAGLAMASLSGSREEFGVGIDGKGMVVAWGSDRYGQASPPPGLIAKSVIAGQGPRSAHALALLMDGTVAGWGDDTFGQATAPVGLKDVVDVAAGETFSLALRADGTVLSWGSLSIEESGVKAIAAGAGFVVLLLEDGSLNCFGKEAPQLEGKAIAIAAGNRHVLVLRENGQVTAWGTEVPDNLPRVKAVYAGAEGSACLGVDGKLYGWGLVPELDLENVVHLAIGRGEVLVLAR